MHPSWQFVPTRPKESILPLKTHPALALSADPPPVPLAGVASPVVIAGNRGFSRSDAGLPWSTSAQSIVGPPVRTGGAWTPFRSEYTSRFGAHSDGLERVLNHQRNVLEGRSSRGFRLPAVGYAPSVQHASFQYSPRGVLLEPGSFRDNGIRNTGVWQERGMPRL